MRLAGVGDNVVDRYVHLGQQFPGGNAVNVAVAAARAGAKASYLGAVGDDEAGRLLLRALVDEDVDVQRVRIRPGATATSQVALVDQERQFLGWDMGVSQFRLEAEDFAYLASYDIVHTGDWGGLEEQLPHLAQLNSWLSFDFSDRNVADYVEPLLTHVDLAFFSAAHLDYRATLQLLRYSVERGARMAVATRGERGAVLWDGEHVVECPSYVEVVVDSLGAGDSFIGAFLTAFADTRNYQEALAAGSAAAALTCAVVGGFGHAEAY